MSSTTATNNVANYTGPTVGTMIRTHTLAAEIIARNNDDATGGCSILDGSELALLRRFCADTASHASILASRDMADEQGAEPGTRASEKYGSLAGYVISRHGSEAPALTEGEIGMLRGWFEGGGADERIAETGGRETGSGPGE